MHDDDYAVTLKAVLDEIKNVCPDVSNTFIFNEQGITVATDRDTPDEKVENAARSFDSLTESAKSIGTIDRIIINGMNQQMSISHANNLNIGIVALKEADQKYLNTTIRVLIQAVPKIVEKIQFTPTEDKPLIEKDEQDIIEPTHEIEVISVDENQIDMTPQPEAQLATQCMIEDLSGLLVSSDTVRIDNGIINEWTELYGEKRIEQVELETLTGNTTRCNFKPMKGSKHEGKGLIQVPQKIQLIIQARRGELVMVKPVVS